MTKRKKALKMEVRMKKRKRIEIIRISIGIKKYGLENKNSVWERK